MILLFFFGQQGAEPPAVYTGGMNGDIYIWPGKATWRRRRMGR